ncbi:DNA-binding protein [Micromonospora sp. PLK6-60]|uniref:DNA-binding protein n=1 Tax=Micromonospora sp. PLK6-60 TaxID=2873383 RepID=UPI0027E1CFD3|nr:DNA-binding protein [Micromonospora sp. PLK6-60]
MAAWFGITQAQLSRVENGPPVVHLDRLTHWARVLRIPMHALWFDLSSKPMDAPSPVDGETRLHLIRALRSADRQIGGKNLYGTVLAHLAAFAGPPKQSPSIPRQALTAAASLHEMAGWMAHDSGDSITSRQHFRQALALAVDSGDQLLVGQVHGSLSHLACHEGNGSAAIAHAADGLGTVVGEEATAGVRARLFALQARGFAAAGRALDCHSSLRLAEAALAETAAAHSAWLSPFDRTSLNIEVARCLLRLGDVTAALRTLDGVVVDEPTARVRSQALARLLLATALVGQSRIEEVCLLTRQTVDLTHGLGSAVVLDQLRHLALLLRSHASRCPEVPQLLDRLRDTFRERSWVTLPLPAR